MIPAEQQATLDEAVTLLKGTTVGYANHSAAWQANQTTKWWQALDRIRRVRESLDPPVPPPPTPSSGWSAWSKPIPPNPPLAPESAAIVQALASQQFMVVKADYTIPVYRATANTARWSYVPLTAEWNVGKRITNCPIDRAWKASPGDDAHLCVIDTDGCHFDFWGFRWVDGLPRAASATTFKPGGTGFATHGQACRAGGSALTAGLITRKEIDAGHIPHALAMACATVTRRGDVVQPATDGFTSLPTTGARLPMGGRIQLDPTTNVTDSVLGYTPATVTVLKALQQYGAIMVDGGGFGFFAEDELTAGQYPGWPLGGSRFLPAALKSRLRVLAHGPSVPKTPRQYNGPECCDKSRIV